MSDYEEYVEVLDGMTEFEVWFDDDEFAFVMSDGEHSVFVGYADDDFELLVSNIGTCERKLREWI